MNPPWARGNKISGTPNFMQAEEYPDGGTDKRGEWILLVQLDSTSVSFHVNFGDAGIAYAVLPIGSTVAKFLRQCA